MTGKPLSSATPLLSLMLAVGMQSAALASDYPPPPGPYRSGPFVAATQDGRAGTESTTRDMLRRPGMLLPADAGSSGNVDEFAGTNLFGAPRSPSATPEAQARPAQAPLPDAAAAGYTGYSAEPAPRYAPENLSEYGPGSAPVYAPPSGYAEQGAPYLPTDGQKGYYPGSPDGYATDPYPLQGPAGSVYAPETGQPFYPASPQAPYPQGRFHGDPATGEPGARAAPADSYPAPRNDAGYAGQAYPDPVQWLDRESPDAGGWRTSSYGAGRTADRSPSSFPGGPLNQAAGGRLPNSTADQGLIFRPPGATPD